MGKARSSDGGLALELGQCYLYQIFTNWNCSSGPVRYYGEGGQYFSIILSSAGSGLFRRVFFFSKDFWRLLIGHQKYYCRKFSFDGKNPVAIVLTVLFRSEQVHSSWCSNTFLDNISGLFSTTHLLTLKLFPVMDQGTINEDPPLKAFSFFLVDWLLLQKTEHFTKRNSRMNNGWAKLFIDLDERR